MASASEMVKLINVRIAFPNLFEPKSFNGQGKEYFSASFILGKDNPQVEMINAVIERLAKEQWKDKAGIHLKAARAGDKVALHDGDLKANYEGFADHVYVQASNTVRPTVLDAKCNPLAESDGKPYAGSYVNAHVQIWVQDNQYGKRINATLCGVQFVRDGDAFGGGARVSSVDDFDVVESAIELAEMA